MAGNGESELVLLRHNLQQLIYCINAKPRLFRWNSGHIEWRPPFRPWRWRRLPMAHNGAVVTRDRLVRLPLEEPMNVRVGG